MKIDLYSKAILAVIAISLVALVFQGMAFSGTAQANIIGQDINVVNLSTDITPGETLHVFFTNC